MKNLFTRSALAAAIALISPNVSAAAFQLNEYSAAVLGRSFSGRVVYVDPDVDISGTSPSGRSTSAKNIAPSEWIPNIDFLMPLNGQLVPLAPQTTVWQPSLMMTMLPALWVVRLASKPLTSI